MDDRQTVHVIACGVLGPGIKHLVQAMGLELKMKFLPGKLHNKADLLRTFLQNAINEASEDSLCSRIVIGYGLCGKGTVSVSALRVPLIFTKIHAFIDILTLTTFRRLAREKMQRMLEPLRKQWCSILMTYSQHLEMDLLYFWNEKSPFT